MWRRVPRQICSDLERFFNRDIKYWHRGTVDEGGDLVLSSYRLLELFGARIDVNPDTGDVDPDSVVVVRDDGVVVRRRYGDLAVKGTRELRFDFAPIDGAVDIAVREGGYSRVESMLADTHNELAWLRLSYQLRNGGKEYKPDLKFDPRVERAREQESKAQREFQREVEEAISGGIDW